MSIGLSAGLAIKFEDLREGVLLVSAMGTLLAAYMHFQHEGWFGEAPWHATSHPFNATLIGVDLLAAGLCAFALSKGKAAAKAKSA